VHELVIKIESKMFYFANTHNKWQEPTDINVLQLRFLIDIFKVFRYRRTKYKWF